MKYQLIIFSTLEDFKFRLKEDLEFQLPSNFGKWYLEEPGGEKVAIVENNKLIVKEGYMWDGSTVVGKYYEDIKTLEASLLHDVLYNAKKNPEGIEVPFNLFEADRVFRDYLKELYKDSDNWFLRNWFADFYYWGLITIGIPWKFGKNDYYRLKRRN